MNVLTKLRSLFRKGKLDAEMAEEMRHHVELQTDLNLKAGMNPDEARYAALRQFGNVASIQERAREARGWVWLEQLGQDLRYALRQLAKAKGFTVVVVLTLALGIGATTAIYSVVNTVILHPVGGSEPERVMQITQRELVQGKHYFQGVCPPVLEALRAERGLFTDLAWSDRCTLERKSEDFVQQENGAYVSWDFFSLLGERPLLGRGFVPEDAVTVSFTDNLPTKDVPIVLSYAWWQSQWGGDPQAVGRIIKMSERHFTVIGVMPSHFRFPDNNTQFWVPANPVVAPPQGARGAYTNVIARLNPGITEQQVQVRLNTIVKRLMSDNPPPSAYGGYWRMSPDGLVILVRSLSVALQDHGDWAQLRQTWFGLSAAIGFVLLIVCANVANLTLARVERRQHELAIRVATGASQGRLMRQLLTENLILALLGGGAGLVVTAWGLKALMALNVMPRLRPVEIDGPLLGVAFALSTLTGLAFGLAPIWRGGRVRVNMLLADGGMNATGGRQRSHYRSALVIAQLAITVVLLTGAGLMLRSVSCLLQVNPGFDPQNLLLVDVWLPWKKYDISENGMRLKSVLLAQLLDRFRVLPGVKAVGLQQSFFLQPFQTDGRADPLNALNARVSVGTGDLFQAMRTPLLAGRAFLPEDAAQPRLVLVNETLAQRFWPGETAIGKKLKPPEPDAESLEVIGVVGDTRAWSYTQEMVPIIYYPSEAVLPITRSYGGGAPQFVIRTDGDPGILTPFVRRELRAAEPALLMPNFRAAKQVLFDSTLAQRTYRNYLGVFAGLGLLLSALGIYGVLAYSVARRTREIGIRLAIGAEARQIHAMIMQQGAWLIGAGIITGLGASMGLTRFLQSQLYHVSPNDPLVMSAVVGLLSVIALVACWLPARRAAKVDPVVALRAE